MSGVFGGMFSLKGNCSKAFLILWPVLVMSQAALKIGFPFWSVPNALNKLFASSSGSLRGSSWLPALGL
jgi:hypothetical protein